MPWPRRRRPAASRVRPLALGIALAGLAAGAFGQQGSSGKGPEGGPPLEPALVDLATVGEGEAAAGSLWVQGTLVSRQDTWIAAEVGGRLVDVAEVGDRLDRGDSLARLDDEALRLDLRADEAEVKRLEARVGYLTKQLERFEALALEQITARTQLDELTSQRVMAEQEAESARVERDRTLHRLRLSTVRAPFAGRVVERLAAAGGFVERGSPVVRLVDEERVEVRAQAPLRHASALREGLAVRVEADGQAREGRVRAAVPVGDERSRTFEFRVLLEESPWPLGSALRVRVPASGGSSESLVTVPRDALVLRRGGAWVWKIEEGTALRVDVVEQGGQGDWIRVSGSGIAPGDRVVVRGGERLAPGQPVRIRRLEAGPEG